MKVNVSFNCDNEMFRNYTSFQIGNVLRVVAAQVEDITTPTPDIHGNIQDVNGDTIGHWKITDED